MGIVRKLLSLQFGAEGSEAPVTLESLLGVTRLANSGTERLYRSYTSQVAALYRKYNGRDELGSWQTRALVDIRTAAIAGEGISVQAKKPETGKWIDNFLNDNALKGSQFFQLVKGAEMTGKYLLNLRAVDVSKTDEKDIQIQVDRIPYWNGLGGVDFKVTLKSPYNFRKPDGVFKKIPGAGQYVSLNLQNFVYVRVGGDDVNFDETTTKVGLALHEIESYDRTLNGMRKNNHLFAQITPVFETKDIGGTSRLLAWIEKVKWKIGMVFAGTAILKYIGPPETAHANYKSEQMSCAKAISTVTGIPVLYIGWTDLLSNRATAEELYEVMNLATTIERTIWAEAIRELIIKAMGLAIDSGANGIKTVDTDFEVKIPIIAFSKLLNYMRALSFAFNDDVISRKDYQNMIPGIDPYLTEEAIKEERAAAADTFATEIENSPEPVEVDE